MHRLLRLLLFFFNDTATTEIYTLSLHDALPIFTQRHTVARVQWFDYERSAGWAVVCNQDQCGNVNKFAHWRSEEHTSELQSHLNLVCRLLLEKKKGP